MAHLTELLWGCARLPEIGEAGVNDWVFQNGDFSGQHVSSFTGRSGFGEVSVWNKEDTRMEGFQSD